MGNTCTATESGVFPMCEKLPTFATIPVAVRRRLVAFAENAFDDDGESPRTFSRMVQSMLELRVFRHHQAFRQDVVVSIYFLVACIKANRWMIGSNVLHILWH
jgi:hypothetical protein